MSSPRVLYLGTDPSGYATEGKLIHYPIIKTIGRVPPPHLFEEVESCTDLLFTSKNGVAFFFSALEHFLYSREIMQNKRVFAVGASTARALFFQGIPHPFVAREETQEGMVALLRLQRSASHAYFFYPRSSLARPILENFFFERGMRIQICDLYDTVTQRLFPLPDLEEIGEIVFTSPSTVQAFLEVFQVLPKKKRFTCLGPVTREALRKIEGKSYH